MKILILVLSLWDNDIYTEFYKMQKCTWDSINIDDVDVYYYFGNFNNDVIVDDKIFLNINEALYNCGVKTLKCFDLVKEFEFDYIFRTNSSSYIDKELLKNWLIDKPKYRFYSGIIGNHNGIYFASGSGYIISRDVFDLILKNKDRWDHNYIDDVSLGLLLKNLNILPIESIRFDVTNDEISPNYFHYRLKSENDRQDDIKNMIKINDLKYGKN